MAIHSSEMKTTIVIEIPECDNDGYDTGKSVKISNEYCTHEMVKISVYDDTSNKWISVSVRVSDLEKLTRTLEWIKSA